MVLMDYLKKCDYDARLERFFDQSMQIESYDIGILKNDYFKTVSIDWDVFWIDCDDANAEFKIDEITTSKYHQAKADANITESANRMLRILYGFEMSIHHQLDYYMIDRFEEDFFDALSNQKQKNYDSLLCDDWDALDDADVIDLNFALHKRIINESAMRLLKCNPNIDLLDVIDICSNFIEIYEPDFDLIDFISRIESNSFADLIESLNAWLQCFIFCNEDCTESEKDYKSIIIEGCVINGF